MADVVAAGNLHQRLSLISPLDRLGLLVRGELRLAPHLHAARLRPRSAFARAAADQVAFKLCIMRSSA